MVVQFKEEVLESNHEHGALGLFRQYNYVVGSY